MKTVCISIIMTIIVRGVLDTIYVRFPRIKKTLDRGSIGKPKIIGRKAYNLTETNRKIDPAGYLVNHMNFVDSLLSKAMIVLSLVVFIIF